MFDDYFHLLRNNLKIRAFQPLFEIAKLQLQISTKFITNAKQFITAQPTLQNIRLSDIWIKVRIHIQGV